MDHNLSKFRECEIITASEIAEIHSSKEIKIDEHLKILKNVDDKKGEYIQKGLEEELKNVDFYNNKMKESGEDQYLNFIQRILIEGDEREDRTGVGTYSLFGTEMRYSLENGTLPLFTTKQVFVRGVFEELMWFLRGQTNSKILEEKGVNIWKANSSRNFLDSQGFYFREEGKIGPGYGHQWRNFNGPYYDDDDSHKNYFPNNESLINKNEKGIDQIQEVMENLKKNPFSRRHIVSAWNPCQINEMALPPCHVMFQFYVDSKFNLSLKFYQRSADMALGVPFNVCSYALLTHMVAHQLGYKAKELIHSIGDAHIYKNHKEPLLTQLERKPFPFPKISFLKKPDHIWDYEFTDLKIENYQYHKSIPMPMNA